MTSSASQPLITDLDGTLVRLAVDWEALRRRLGVPRIADLVARGDSRALAEVAAAEVDGARRGVLNQPAVRFTTAAPAIAVLTNNSEAAVAAFLERVPPLRATCRAVAGRETHGQRKQEPAAFAAMVTQLAAALDRAPADLLYLGDEAYELELAASCGLQPLSVTELVEGIT